MLTSPGGPWAKRRAAASMEAHTMTTTTLPTPTIDTEKVRANLEVFDYGGKLHADHPAYVETYVAFRDRETEYVVVVAGYRHHPDYSGGTYVEVYDSHNEIAGEDELESLGPDGPVRPREGFDRDDALAVLVEAYQHGIDCCDGDLDIAPLSTLASCGYIVGHDPA